MGSTYCKLIICGYMGSGKTSVGRRLASLLSYDFIDLDEMIERTAGKSITEIFREPGGELIFRRMEHALLLDILDRQGPYVLSLGGGTPCYYDHMERILMAGQAYNIYLKASISLLVERLYNEEAQKNRPLTTHLNDKETATEFIAKHLFERNPFYSRANLTIPVDRHTCDEIAHRILAHLSTTL